MRKKAWLLGVLGCGGAIIAGALVSCVSDTMAPTDSGTPDSSSGMDTAMTDMGVAETMSDAGCGPCDAGCYGGVCNGNRVVFGSMGQLHGCALLAGGEVWCWGQNQFGQLGIAPPTMNISAPTRVMGLPPIQTLAVGAKDNCAIAKGTNEVWCWGVNYSGELGHAPGTTGDLTCQNSTRCNPTPTKVPGIVATQIGTGEDDTCALSTTGGAYCWGSEWVSGQGFIDAGINPTPQGVVGLTNNVTQVAFGKYPGYSACALKTDKTVWCWGGNHKGQLGHTPNTLGDVGGCAVPPCHLLPAQVTLFPDGGGGPLGNVTQILAGWVSCAVKGDGTVWCWGDDGRGQLATGSIGSMNPQPGAINGVTGAVQISGNSTLCERGTDVRCWGESDQGELAFLDGGLACTMFTGGNARCTPSPVVVPLTNVVNIDVGLGAALAVLADGKLLAWGRNSSGQLGHTPGSMGDVNGVNPTPQQVQGLP